MDGNPESANRKVLDDNYYEWQVARKLISTTAKSPTTEQPTTTEEAITTMPTAITSTIRIEKTEPVNKNGPINKTILLEKLGRVYEEYKSNPMMFTVLPRMYMHSVMGMIDFGKLDIRVGRITEIMFHPNTNKMYICDVDVGIGKPLPVVGSLGSMEIADLNMRWVLVLCNIQPVEMNGVTSFGKILLAMKGELMEPLTPPQGSQPGDVVQVRGYTRNPYRQLEPRFRIYQFISQLFNVNSDSIAVCRGRPWEVLNVGFVHTYRLNNCIIR